MAGGEESFAGGSPSSQVINRDSPEASVAENQPVDTLEAVVSATPTTLAATRAVPATVIIGNQ